MGGNLVFLTERQYMERLKERILEDYEASMNKRIKQREVTRINSQFNIFNLYLTILILYLTILCFRLIIYANNLIIFTLFFFIWRYRKNRIIRFNFF